jgi:hypothetical protein
MKIFDKGVKNMKWQIDCYEFLKIGILHRSIDTLLIWMYYCVKFNIYNWQDAFNQII